MSAFVCQIGNHIVNHPNDRYTVALEARRQDSMHRLFRIVVMDLCKVHAEEYEAAQRRRPLEGQESML